jgi:hypothetical protein
MYLVDVRDRFLMLYIKHQHIIDTDLDNNNETLPMKEEISRIAIHLHTLFLLAHVV